MKLKPGYKQTEIGVSSTPHGRARGLRQGRAKK
jgi:hypothetical protein